MKKPRTGKDGSELHQEIMDWIREQITPYFMDTFSNIKWNFIYDDLIMSWALLADTDKKDGFIPDVLWTYDNNLLVIEIGRYQPDKWPPGLEVIHIAFNANVSLINGRTDIAKLIRDEFQFMALYDDLSPFKKPIEQPEYTKRGIARKQKNNGILVQLPLPEPRQRLVTNV